MYTQADLNFAFTNMIFHILNMGYNISPTTGGGSYGTYNYIDFVSIKDKTDFIRLWSKSDNVLISQCAYNTVVFSAQKYTVINSNQICWPNDGTVILSRTFYTIKDNQYYTDNLNDFKEILKLRHTRYAAKQLTQYFNVNIVNADKLPLKFKAAILERIKSLKGFKRAKIDVIKHVEIQQDTHLNSKRLSAAVYYTYNDKSGRIILT